MKLLQENAEFGVREMLMDIASKVEVTNVANHAVVYNY